MISDFLSLTIQLAIPIVLGALCGTISERGGVIMLGVEGMMLIGAFCGAFASYKTGSAFLGLLFAAVMGGVLGYVYWLFCIRFKAHQSVVGVGMNMLASGLTAVLVKAVWGSEGMGEVVPTMANVTIPGLCDIPVLSAFFDNQTLYMYIMFAAVAGTWFFFRRTKVGLRYRAIGDHPVAVRTCGIDVNKYRCIALCVAGALASIGGSYLSLSLNNLFVTDMTAGRGFMALAASIFGGWSAAGCLLASSVFALAQALRFYLTDIQISKYFIQMIPYISTLIILVFVGKRAKTPEALGRLID